MPPAGCWEGLRHAEAAHQLCDIWRERNPEARTFTYVSHSSCTAARLDCWFVSEGVRRWVSPGAAATGQAVGYPGDHLGISDLRSQEAPSASPAGGGTAWRLPLHVPDDAASCETIQARVPALSAAQPINPACGQRWEALEREIRDHAVSRSLSLRASGARPPAGRRQTAGQLRQHLQQPQQTPPPWPPGRRPSSSCCSSTRLPPGGAALQAGLVWAQYGEQLHLSGPRCR